MHSGGILSVQFSDGVRLPLDQRGELVSCRGTPGSPQLLPDEIETRLNAVDAHLEERVGDEVALE